MEALRGPEGLRRWTNADVVPRPGDVFQERLYCIRWINAKVNARYAAPEAADLARETKVLELLRERFAKWQREGFIPSKAIPEGGDKTEEPIRTRGWTHWHHLFTPRQLLMHGLLAKSAERGYIEGGESGMHAGVGRMANWRFTALPWNTVRLPKWTKGCLSDQALKHNVNYGIQNPFDT